ncbi:MAG: hypothetical protein R3264_16200 [Anaerolineae bacterium]|nr:hypothetical protein [Anaerolineae bacterium]
MAKRKRGNRKGFKLRVETDYRSEAYVMYVMAVETGILQAGTIALELTDGDVSKALASLINALHDDEAALDRLLQLVSEEDDIEVEEGESLSLIEQFISMNLKQAFEQHGPLNATDVAGVLDVIKTSVKRWGHGDHRRGYLTYIEGFLGEAGVRVMKLSKDEAMALGFEDNDPPSLKQGD